MHNISELTMVLSACMDLAGLSCLCRYKSLIVVPVLFFQKYPQTRPIIVAPKIMLQPWEKEFKKWNVDIPVYNFNKADFEQGRAILQQHEEAGDVQLNQGGRSQFKKKLVYREVLK